MIYWINGITMLVAQILIRGMRFVAHIINPDVMKLTKINRSNKFNIMFNDEYITINTSNIDISFIDITESVYYHIKQIGNFDCNDFYEKLLQCYDQPDLSKYDNHVLVYIQTPLGNKLTAIDKQLYKLLDKFIGKIDLQIEFTLNELDYNDDVNTFNLNESCMTLFDSSHIESYVQLHKHVKDDNYIRKILEAIIDYINKINSTVFTNKTYRDALSYIS